MKVLFIETYMSVASPLKTLSKSIQENGSDIFFIDLSKKSTFDLISLYLKADVIVLQHYVDLPDYSKRQLAIAVFLGVPIVRNWAGTDALNVVTKPAVKQNALLLDRLVARNVTFSHLGLVSELASVGLKCDILPKIVEFHISKKEKNADFIPQSVLVYLPSSTRKFYGSDYIEVLITKFPKTHFTIIADDEHHFAKYHNVASLGWVDKSEMLKVWDKIGLLIRITEHDGFPRMILEALGRGKYVIHNNNSIEGVWYADDQESIELQLNDYLNKNEINYNGIQIFEALKQREPGKSYHNYLSCVKTPLKKWLNAMLYLLKIKSN